MRGLPEEPLRNACVASMSVADNIGLRSFDEPPFAHAGWRVPGALLPSKARALIATYRVKTQGEGAPIGSLSGGNVQRAVLARELSRRRRRAAGQQPGVRAGLRRRGRGPHARLVAARNRGAAVLLVSEDLDELLHVADRIVVMSGGRLVHACAAAGADRHDIGRHMGGHGGGHAVVPVADGPGQRGCGLASTRRPHEQPTPIAARPFTFDLQPGRAALVIIDMQRDFIEPGGFGESLGNDVALLEAAVGPTLALLQAWRARGWPVVHTRESHLSDLSDCPPAKRLRGNPQPAHRRCGSYAAACWCAASRATRSSRRWRRWTARSSSTSPARVRSTPRRCRPSCRPAA